MKNINLKAQTPEDETKLKRKLQKISGQMRRSKELISFPLRKINTYLAKIILKLTSISSSLLCYVTLKIPFQENPSRKENCG